VDVLPHVGRCGFIRMSASSFHFVAPIRHENLEIHFLTGPSVPPDYLTLAEGCSLQIVEVLVFSPMFFSATDIANFVACGHLLTLKMEAATETPPGPNRLRELLKQLGIIRSLGAHDVFTAPIVEQAGFETHRSRGRAGYADEESCRGKEIAGHGGVPKAPGKALRIPSEGQRRRNRLLALISIHPARISACHCLS
jgi:hypothetical protein